MNSGDDFHFHDSDGDVSIILYVLGDMGKVKGVCMCVCKSEWLCACVCVCAHDPSALAVVLGQGLQFGSVK